MRISNVVCVSCLTIFTLNREFEGVIQGFPHLSSLPVHSAQLMRPTQLRGEDESRTVKSDTSVRSTDWILSLCVTALVVGWQLSAGSSFTAKVAGVLMFGGLTLGISLHLFEWDREWEAGLINRLSRSNSLGKKWVGLLYPFSFSLLRANLWHSR